MSVFYGIKLFIALFTRAQHATKCYKRPLRYSHRTPKFVDVGLLGCNAMWTCKQIPTFRRNILPPSSGLMRALKKEVVCSSETLVSTFTIYLFSKPTSVFNDAMDRRDWMTSEWLQIQRTAKSHLRHSCPKSHATRSLKVNILLVW
jgi:hypothetical protein